MRRRWFWILTVLLATAACRPKPTEAECRAAIATLQRLIGTDHIPQDETQHIRSCLNGSSRAEVLCTAEAKSMDDVTACRTAAQAQK